MGRHCGLCGISVKMNKPLFSCVVPVKGARPYLAEALESLEAQGMGSDLEVIVQDGDIEPDSGQSDALNRGFAKAKGEWLFWLNADDVLLPGALGKVKEFLAAKNAEDAKGINWLAGDTVYIDEHDKVRDVRCDAKWRPWFGHHLCAWVGGPSAFFRRELWNQRGGFDPELKYVMDIDLWTRWAKAGERFAALGDYVWGFRVHDGSKTMCGRNLADYGAERARMVARHGLRHEGFWRNLNRVVSVLDGSWVKRKYDSAKMKGMAI